MVDLPRFHHQWKPDILYLQNGFSPKTRQRVDASMGFRIVKPTDGVARGWKHRGEQRRAGRRHGIAGCTVRLPVTKRGPAAALAAMLHPAGQSIESEYQHMNLSLQPPGFVRHRLTTVAGSSNESELPDSLPSRSLRRPATFRLPG